ncbi:MAG: hypothetical protein FWD53_04930 [Phycisphaerales bacterium]|nr:hypothetical protein [Phycisphaerales bacterium]
MADPSATVLYIDPSTEYLMKVNIDGSDVQVLVPQRMTDYQITPDFQRCLFARDDELFLWSSSAEQVRKIVTLSMNAPGSRSRDHPVMSAVTMSPSGKRVAFMGPTPGTDPTYGFKIIGHRLKLYDMDTEKVVELPSSLDHESRVFCLTWSTDERILMSQKGYGKDRSILQLRLSESFDRIDEEINGVGTFLAEPVYGTFGLHAPGAYPHFLKMDDRSKELYAKVWRMPHIGGQFVRISRVDLRDDPHEVKLGDNTGPLGLFSNRLFTDIGVVSDSSLCVLEDLTFSMLYVIDYKTRTLGKLGAGKRMALMTTKYQPAKYFMDAPESVP